MTGSRYRDRRMKASTGQSGTVERDAQAAAGRFARTSLAAQRVSARRRKFHFPAIREPRSGIGERAVQSGGSRPAKPGRKGTCRATLYDP
jgi:hypothetical protein